MATFAQDQYGGILITNGETQILQGAQAGAVKLFNQFRLFAGTWFRDLRVGMPYWPGVLGQKGVQPGILSQLFRNVLLKTPGVKGAEVSVTIDGRTRTANVQFQAQWDDGSVITATQLDQPFLVQLPQVTNQSVAQ